MKGIEVSSWEDPVVIKELRLEEQEPGSMGYYWLQLVRDGLGRPIYLPVVVARGIEDGKVLGLTAAVHGNEINGIPVIHRVVNTMDVGSMKGTIVAIPVVNVPSFLRKKRRFNDGVDLNHIMPGKTDGNVSEVYAHRLTERAITKFDYLLDLHTASFGRVNSYYIRADMEDEETARIANLQNAQIIVHNTPSDGTLRGAAEAMGIKAVTLEVGDPNTFQRGIIRSSLTGIHNTMIHLGMKDEKLDEEASPPILCHHSYWLYTDDGGILIVHPDVTDRVQKDECVATLYDIFGRKKKKYYAPEKGVVVGKSVSPVSQTGARILHLGIEKQ